jgi:uncharacterized protein
MIHVFKNVLLTVFFLLCLQVHAQEGAAIRAVARAQQKEKQVLIRWGVTTAQAWKYSNQHGFKVTRFTVVRDKAMLAVPERKELGVLKPAALAAWEQAAAADEYAAIIAQALYGESFEVGGSGADGILSVVNKAEEAEQRFILSLYAAERSFNAALLAGWGLADTDVKRNEKYLYRIQSAAPARLFSIDSAAVFIGLEDHDELPEVSDISALFTDKAATLSWDYDGLKDFYSAFYIERSSDGTNFYRVTEKPVMKMTESEDKRRPARVHYIDTLGMNGVTYHYRVRGVTPFGETGPPSKAVSGMGKKLLAYVPHIIRSVIDETGSVQLEWEFESAGDALISGFTLNQSSTAQGPYRAVVKNIASAKRTAAYDKLFDANYFTITAEAMDGESGTSMPVLVQPLDSIAPAAPVNLRVQVDSTGVATLTWTANSERDLYGYKVFRAYVKHAELTPLTDTVYFGTTFTDTVSMRMTNRKIFYAVTALDRRFNQSLFSPRVAAMKPDVIAPTAPVFTRYALADYKVKLNWADARDKDVASHALYRKTDSGEEWTLVQRFKSVTPGEYIDSDVARGHRYTYTLISKDSSNLESKPAAPVSIKVPGDPDDLTVNFFNAFVDRDKHHIELFWTDDQPDVEEYQLYRKKKGDPTTLWKIVQYPEKGVVDNKLIINTEYTYGIRVVTRSGEMSRMKWVVVKY